MYINPDRPESTVIEKFVMDSDYEWTEIHNYTSNDEISDLQPIFRELYYESVVNCKRYGGDVITDILSICKEFIATNRAVSYFYIGFRESGTDHTAFIEIRLSNTTTYGIYRENYKSMYKVVVDKTFTYNKLSMYKLQKGQ